MRRRFNRINRRHRLHEKEQNIKKGNNMRRRFNRRRRMYESNKLRMVYDNLMKGDEVTIKYSSPWDYSMQTFIVKKGKTTVGRAKVERITLVSIDNPRGVKYYLYNRKGKISFAIGDMGAIIEDIWIV